MIFIDGYLVRDRVKHSATCKRHAAYGHGALIQKKRRHPAPFNRRDANEAESASRNYVGPGGGALQSPCPPASAALRPPPLLTTGGHPHPAARVSARPFEKRRRLSALSASRAPSWPGGLFA